MFTIFMFFYIQDGIKMAKLKIGMKKKSTSDAEIPNYREGKSRIWKKGTTMKIVKLETWLGETGKRNGWVIVEGIESISGKKSRYTAKWESL